MVLAATAENVRAADADSDAEVWCILARSKSRPLPALLCLAMGWAIYIGECCRAARPLAREVGEEKSMNTQHAVDEHSICCNTCVLHTFVDLVEYANITGKTISRYAIRKKNKSRYAIMQRRYSLRAVNSCMHEFTCAQGIEK